MFSFAGGSTTTSYVIRPLAAAIDAKRGAGHVGGRAWRAVAVEQEDRLRQPPPQAGHHVRLRGADDGAERAVAALADQAVAGRDGRELVRQHLAERPAVVGL